MAEVTQSNQTGETGQDDAQAAVILEGRAPYDQLWLTSVLRPVLIAVLIICVDTVLLAFIGRLAPSLAGGYVPMILSLSVIAVIVACVTTTWLTQPQQRHRRTPGYRLAEVALLVVITRVAIWVATGAWPAPADLLIEPFSTLLDGPFIVGGLIVAFSWLVAANTTDDLMRLALQPDELYAMQIDRLGEIVRTSHSDRPAVLRTLVTRWVGGGILLVILAASLQLGASANGLFALARQNIQPSVIGAIVIYFLAGLVLISQGQLALLRSRWTIDRVPSTANVMRHWPLYVFLLLLLMGAIAALLPFGDTFYLAQILGAAISLLFNFILGIFRFLMTLLLMIISLFTGEPPPPPPATPAPPPPQPVFEVPPQAAQWPVWTGGLLFWITMALLLGYAAYIYFSGKGLQFSWLIRFWALLRARWRQLFGAYQEWQLTRVRTTAAARAGQGEAGEEALSWWRTRNLDPNQRVRYLYLSLLQEAKQRGFARIEGETPLRYAPRLVQALHTAHIQKMEAASTTEAPAPPEVEAERAESAQAVHELTQAFVHVRYAQQTVEPARIPQLQQLWEKIRRQLHV